MRRIRDWVFTIPFLLAFGLSLAAFDLAGRVVRPFSLRGFERVMAGLQRTLIALFRISGTRIEVERSPNIEPNRGYALVSNHQSMLDIPVIGGLLVRNYPKYVAKKSLGRWIPSISLNLRKGGNALIDRSDGIGAVRTISRMARTAQERDVSVVIFPEGTRSRDGVLGRFHRSGAQALLRAADRLPVVPVAIDGSWKLMMKNMLPLPFGTTIKVRLGDPIERRARDWEQLVHTTEEWIRETLESWRSPQPATA
jgi:1-acyl-sn-glycerol-3-phosphate acyltransferase